MTLLTPEQIEAIRQRGHLSEIEMEDALVSLCYTAAVLYARPFECKKSGCAVVGVHVHGPSPLLTQAELDAKVSATETALEKMKEERDLWAGAYRIEAEPHRNRVQVTGGKTEDPRRAVFAAAALQGLLAQRGVGAEDVAALARINADALIAELDKSPATATKRRAGLWRSILGSPGHVRDARDIPGDCAASVLPKASYWQWRIAGGRGDGFADGSEDTAEKAQAAADEALRKAGWELES